MKKSKQILLAAILVGFIFIFQACTKYLEENTGVQRVLKVDTHVNYNNTDYPDHLQSLQFDQINNDMAALGRVLFYDELLSSNARVSCASCHLQSKAFSDGMKSSQGFALGQTPRNSMAMSNLSMSEWGLFWDVRAQGLSNQVTMPMLNHLEMGNANIEQVIERIKSREYYQPFFTQVYGSFEVTEQNIAEPLAEFIRALRSYKSAFDAAIPPAPSGGFSWQDIEAMGPDFENPSQRAGFTVFGEMGCNNCHTGTNIGGNGAANIGLEIVYTDKGVGEWSTEPSLEGVFKVPSLRNIALTGPYMHDGRFATLEEVVNHYNEGILPHPNLDWELTTIADDALSLSSMLNNQVDPIDILTDNIDFDEIAGQRTPRKMNMTEQNKRDLIAFLQSLTDYSFISDTRFSDPFILEEIQ